MFVKQPPKNKLIVKMFEMGPAIDHNLVCWLCDKRSAVYYTWPKFIFYPCWRCQEKYEGAWTKKKPWYKLWKQSQLYSSSLT